MKRILVLAFLAGLAVSPAALAQNWPGATLTPQNEARDARSKGRTMPLSAIKQQLKSRYGGDMSDAVMYSGRNGGYSYEISWIDRDGRRLVLDVDAQSGRVRSARGR